MCAPPEAAVRQLVVPPPSREHDSPQHHLPRGPHAPNAKLVQAMTGRVADVTRIQRMAERIRLPCYSLREFFDDCLASFPELRLFFLGDASICTTSGESNEGEYQRTVGALFSCYWLLRLQVDAVVAGGSHWGQGVA